MTYVYKHLGSFRLLLAALVMVQHFGADLAPLSLAKVLAPYAIGSIAVLAFFALSGFVIAEAVDCIYQRRAGAFLSNRLLRIVPHFILAVALSMLAHAAFRWTDGVRLWRSQPSFPADAFLPGNVLLNFVGIVPMADRFMDYNFLDITWAIRIEMAFYVVMWFCIAVGGNLPLKRGFVWVAAAISVLLSPLFVLAMWGHAADMFGFLPFFAFGVGLYFATLGQGCGWLTITLTIPAMVWQCIVKSVAGTGPLAVRPSVVANLILLALLIAILVILAFAKIKRGRATDRFLGNLTYPLYLYHEDVLVIVLTFTVGYSYVVFSAGILLSLLTAAMLGALVDPPVNRFRDKIRGGSLRNHLRPQVSASTAAIEETPTTV